MATSRLDILINAKNKASPQLKTVSKDIGGLSKAATGAVAAMGAMGVAFAAVKIGGIVVDLAKSADAAKRVEESYRKLAENAGQSADVVLAAMQKMSAGTISETDLMLSANRAMLLGVADSAEEMSALMEVALERGSALGLPAQQAFNDIVTGIGRLSPMILDNLGIIVDADAAYAAYADSVGKAADELTKAEQKQAILNSILREADGELDVSIDKFAALEVSAEKAKIAIGELAAPTVIAGFAALTEAADAFIDALDRIKSGETTTLEALKDRMIGDIANQQAGYQAIGNEIEKLNYLLGEAENKFVTASNAGEWETVGKAAKEIEFLKAQIDVSIEAMNSLSEASGGVLAEVPERAAAAVEALDTTTESVEKNIEAIIRLSETPLSYDIGEVFEPAWLEDAKRTIASMGQSMVGDLGAGGTLEWMDQALESVREQRAEWAALGIDLKVIDDTLLPGFVATLNDIAPPDDAFAGMLADMQSLRTTIDSIAGTFATDAFGEGGAKAAAAAYREMQEELRAQIPIWQANGHSIEFITGTLLPAFASGIREAGSATVAEMSVAQSAVERFADAVRQAVAEIQALERRTNATLQSMSSRLVGTLGEAGAISFYEDSQVAVANQRKEWIALYKDVEYVDNILMPSYIASLDDAYQKTTSVARATGGVASAVGTVSKAYSDVQGKISSILSSAIGPVGGINAEDFLPREDAINENARRLADIMVNGLTGQDWIGEFAAEAPDVYAALLSGGDVKTTAAQIMRDFQDGLVPQLIDKDAAKERVKRMILGEQNTAALAQQIAQELSAEMGIALQDAQVAAGAALGSGAAGESPVVAQLKSSESRIGSAGTDAGKVWGVGFLSTVGDNVPAALINVLVNLTTPGVMAQLTIDSSRAGAS